jgi:hypothetical protein
MSQINTAYAPIWGVHQGLTYSQNERVEELNDRISARNTADTPLAPNFDPRPVPTKYHVFPILNHRASPQEIPLNTYNVHNVHTNFNAGNDRAPPDGFLRNVDNESSLRNLGVALQHGADQGVYVPSSTSDLYRTPTVYGSQMEPQPHPRLFTGIEVASVHPDALRLQQTNIGKDRFFNHTRTQLRTPVNR